MSVLTFSTLIDNGGDVLQILFFMILSEIFVVAAVCAQGTERAFRSAFRLFCEFIRLIFVLVAAFTSLAVYFSALGVQSNPYGLSTYSGLKNLQLISMPGLAAVAVFICLALCHMSASEESRTGDVFAGLPKSEYNGIPRALLQIWLTGMSFLESVLITQLFFPWFVISEAAFIQAYPFLARILTLALFWLTVIIIRTFGIRICGRTRTFLEAKSSPAAVAFLMLLLACAAMGIIWYEAYKAAAEVY